ncbi:MAG: ribose 5-phosphate isomerase B [Helicobacter sp.]|nr:ribose 5-phosphate isomerase B [Helicobacter sp.]
MKFYIANDHAGIELKKTLAQSLHTMGHDVLDLGCNNENSVDYPDFAAKLCQEVLKDSGSFGLLICGSGIGMSIAANRFNGIRAALCSDPYSAAMSRKHNDANVLCLGARIIGIDMAQNILQNFCQAQFEGGRHLQRIKKMQ